MQDRRAKISFWITVVSFVGSILFIGNMILTGDTRSKECRECVDKMLYYQHRADSLQYVLHHSELLEEKQKVNLKKNKK